MPMKLFRTIDNYFFDEGEEEIKPYFYGAFLVGMIAIVISLIIPI